MKKWIVASISFDEDSEEILTPITEPVEDLSRLGKWFSDQQELYKKDYSEWEKAKNQLDILLKNRRDESFNILLKELEQVYNHYCKTVTDFEKSLKKLVMFHQNIPINKHLLHVRLYDLQTLGCDIDYFKSNITQMDFSTEENFHIARYYDNYINPIIRLLENNSKKDNPILLRQFRGLSDKHRIIESELIKPF
jgi:t-SNARE complex subunit (syntaxin)